MKPLYGTELAKKLRSIAEKVNKRLWVCVPYLGEMDAALKVLGKTWLENGAVEVRLLTDVSDMTSINPVLLKAFHERGDVRTLTGVHAKIYIMDDCALITSANLTRTAFECRHEIGIVVQDARDVVAVFEEWWLKATQLNSIEDKPKFSGKREVDEETKVRLPKLWELPKSPAKVSMKKAEYANYERLLLDFKDFAKKYEKIQRIWPKEPIYMEIDGFFNFLYHVMPSPSKDYYKRQPRVLEEKRQISEIQKWAKKYNDWNNKQETDDIEWRKNYSNTIRRLLAKGRIDKLTKTDIKEILDAINSMNSYAINKTRVLNNNTIETIRDAFSQLVHGQGTVGARISSCVKSIKFFGKSSANELIGCYFPDQNPLINQNSISGLRFFGYHSKL